MLFSQLHSQPVFCTFVSVCESTKRAFCGGEHSIISVFVVSSPQTKMSTSPYIKSNKLALSDQKNQTSKKLGMATPRWIEHVKKELRVSPSSRFAICLFHLIKSVNHHYAYPISCSQSPARVHTGEKSSSPFLWSPYHPGADGDVPTSFQLFPFHSCISTA